MLLSVFVYHYVALVGYFTFLFTLLLALGPTGALAQFDNISYSSISQCGNFSVTFTGGHAPSALPLQLTVVALNDTAYILPLPDSSWNDTSLVGAAFTFLPLRAGQQFIASLDDANGNPTGVSSDIIEVAPSDDTDCLSTGSDDPLSLYAVQGELSQCATFNLTYNFTSVFPDPAIRAFEPTSQSFKVNQASLDPILGVSVYTMDALHDTQVVMLFNDSHGHLQVTDMLPVGGDTLSSTSCLPSPSALSPDVQNTSASGDDGATSSPAKLST